jgi:phosphatidylglycerol:prolipoprotein diacylglycerol transferase
MRPILFEIFGWEVPSWHFFFMLAAFTAFAVTRLCARRAIRSGIAGAEKLFDAVPNLFVICYVSGWLGARALSIAVEQLEVTTFLGFLSQLFQIGPMTFYGGALCAVICGLFFCRFMGISLKLALDCGMIGGVFGLGVGRIGCHLNGDDFGLAIADQSNPHWWAVTFPSLRDGGIYRFPVQLEEALASFLIGLFGIWLFFKLHALKENSQARFGEASQFCGAGRVAALMGLLTAANRFFNEMFRGDPRGLFFGTTLSTSSGIALLIAIVSIIALIRIELQQRCVHLVTEDKQ